MNKHIKQNTIKKDVKFSGIGLHSGENSSVTLRPAAENAGITFIKTNKGEQHTIPADFKFISNSQLCTTLQSYDAKSKIFTVRGTPRLLASW